MSGRRDRTNARSQTAGRIEKVPRETGKPPLGGFPARSVKILVEDGAERGHPVCAPVLSWVGEVRGPIPRSKDERIFKAIVAGLCGSVAHSLLMYFKARTGLLPSFQPYDNLQRALGGLLGREVHPIVPWALSFLNGSTLVGLAFGHAYRSLPGRTGAMKGMIFGLLGWAVMGLIFFPLIGLGVFAFKTELGIFPALFSLAMLLTYSIVLGAVYEALGA